MADKKAQHNLEIIGEKARLKNQLQLIKHGVGVRDANLGGTKGGPAELSQQSADSSKRKEVEVKDKAGGDDEEDGADGLLGGGLLADDGKEKNRANATFLPVSPKTRKRDTKAQSKQKALEESASSKGKQTSPPRKKQQTKGKKKQGSNPASNESSGVKTRNMTSPPEKKQKSKGQNS